MFADAMRQHAAAEAAADDGYYSERRTGRSVADRPPSATHQTQHVEDKQFLNAEHENNQLLQKKSEEQLRQRLNVIQKDDQNRCNFNNEKGDIEFIEMDLEAEERGNRQPVVGRRRSRDEWER